MFQKLIAKMGSIAKDPEAILPPKVKATIAANQDKASRDFRSDVVTVPTEGMMEVRITNLRQWFRAKEGVN